MVQRASKVRGMGKVMKTCASSASEARSIIRRMKSEPRKAWTMLLLRKNQILNPFNRTAVVCL